MTALEPGWYADPAGRAEAFRWWDGTAWTRWLSRDRQAAEPVANSAEPAQTAESDPTAGSSPIAAGQPGPVEPAVRAPLAVAILIGAVLLAFVAVGAVVALSTERLPSGPPVAPPAVVPPIPKTPVTVDAGTRKASAQEFRAVLPGAPFICDPPKELAGLFGSAVGCSAVVHRDYNDTGDDWYSSQVFGILDQNLVEPGDPAATADELVRGIATAYYANERVTVKKRSLKRLVDIAPDGKAVLLTMQFHYSVKGLDSRYDRIVIGLFQLADGEFGTWLASNPNDAPDKLGKVLDASAATVRAR